jgi:hypothetical protein
MDPPKEAILYGKIIAFVSQIDATFMVKVEFYGRIC